MNLLTSLAPLFITTLLTVFVIYLTFLTLKFTTKPRLKISPITVGWKNGYTVEEVANLKFLVENVGYWYSHPAATNVKIYVNFDPEFSLESLKFGSQLEITDSNVQRGKRGSKYLIAKGIQLSHYEPGEEIEAKVRMPKEEGQYKCWLCALSDQGDCGVHKFLIDVRYRRKTATITFQELRNQLSWRKNNAL